MPWREQFPALDDDIDRRIEHSEGRIKYWVIAGILANLIALIGIGVPLVYYFGAMQTQAAASMTTMLKTSQDISALDSRLRNEELHTQMIDNWAQDKGFRSPLRFPH